MNTSEILIHVKMYILLAVHLLITISILLGPIIANRKSLPWVLLIWPIIATTWIIDTNNECIITKLEYKMRELDPTIEPGFISRIVSYITGFVPSERQVTTYTAIISTISWLIGYYRLTRFLKK